MNAMLFCILFFTVYSVAVRFHANASNASHLALGMLAAVSFFFRLRVFDEVKDYEIDAVNHPQRVLQSGRVSLRQLAIVSAIASLAEVVWSLMSGVPTLVCWLAAVAYSLLMRYEFFAPNFLKKRLFLYAVTHLLIMPFVMVWIWSAYAEISAAATGLWLLCALGLIGGFSFELARKIHAPAEEREGVDSYSKSLGFKTAVGLVLTFLLAGIAVQCWLLQLLEARPWPYLLLGLLFPATALLYMQSLKQPDEKRLRLCEVVVSLFMLVSYLSVIIESRLH